MKVLHAHTLSIGGEFERDRIDADDYSYTPGDNTFNGQRTAAPTGATLPAGTTKSGSALADFYLGLDSQFFQGNGRKFYLRVNRPSLYVQDDWKVNRKLTLNLGVRWDPWLPPNDLNGTLVAFKPGVQSTVAPVHQLACSLTAMRALRLTSSRTTGKTLHYTQNYNFTIEQQLGSKMAFSLAYVDNHSEHIMGSRQFNPAVFGPGATMGNENSRRLYPGLGAVELAQSYEYEGFNSLQATVTRRASNGLTLLSNIVWSKTSDNTSSATEGNTGPPNPFNLASARGPADFDQTIRYNASVNYLVPHANVQGWKSAVLNDWQVNGIVSLQTGFPFTVLSGTDRSL